MGLCASILLGSLVCQLTGRPFGQSLPVGYLGAGLVLYLGTLLTGSFTVSYALVIAISLCSVLLVWKRRPGKALDKILLTPGFFAFLALYIFVFFAQSGRSFQWWDELSHWGPMVKETLRLGTFYSVPASSLGIHKDYPPFFTLLEAFWCRLCRGYSEATLYRALLTVELSLFLPMFEAIRPGKWLPTAAKVLGGCALTLLGCSVICGDIPFFTSVYLDYPLALLLAYGLYLIVTEEQPSLFQGAALAFTGSAILLTKQMGIAFYLMILGLLTAVFLWQLLFAGERKSLLKRQAMVWLPTALVPLVFSKSWSLYTAGLALEGQFSMGDMKLSQLPGIWAGTAGDEVQQQVIRIFADAYLHKNLWAAGAGRMELSYFRVTLLFAAGLAVLTLLGWKALRGSSLLFLDAVLLGGSACYALVMLVTYLYGFSDYEATHLASYSRYMNTYWFAAAAVMVMLFFTVIQTLKDRQGLALLAAAALLILAELRWEQPHNLRNLLPQPEGMDSPTLYHAGDAAILAGSTPENARVFVIDQHSTGLSTHVLRYMVSPRTINDNYFSLGAPYEEGDVWTADLTADKLAETLQGWDYLYFVYVDGQFVEAYGDLLPDAPHAGGLYRVTGTQPLTLEQVYHD